MSRVTVEFYKERNFLGELLSFHGETSRLRLGQSWKSVKIFPADDGSKPWVKIQARGGRKATELQVQGGWQFSDLDLLPRKAESFFRHGFLEGTLGESIQAVEFKGMKFAPGEDAFLIDERGFRPPSGSFLSKPLLEKIHRAISPALPAGYAASVPPPSLERQASGPRRSSLRARGFRRRWPSAKD